MRSFLTLICFQDMQKNTAEILIVSEMNSVNVLSASSIIQLDKLENYFILS